MKEFLLKVKYGVSNIRDLSDDILSLYQGKEIVNKSKEMEKQDKKTIGFYHNECLPNLLEKKININLPDINNNNNRYNSNDLIKDNLFITPIKFIKRKLTIHKSSKSEQDKKYPNFQRSIHKNKTQILSIKAKYDLNQKDNITVQNDIINSQNERIAKSNKDIINNNDNIDTAKEIIIKNYPIFETPEDFKHAYDLLTNKIKN